MPEVLIDGVAYVPATDVENLKRWHAEALARVHQLESDVECSSQRKSVYRLADLAKRQTDYLVEWIARFDKASKLGRQKVWDEFQWADLMWLAADIHHLRRSVNELLNREQDRLDLVVQELVANAPHKWEKRRAQR